MAAAKRFCLVLRSFILYLDNVTGFVYTKCATLKEMIVDFRVGVHFNKKEVCNDYRKCTRKMGTYSREE